MVVQSGVEARERVVSDHNSRLGDAVEARWERVAVVAEAVDWGVDAAHRGYLLLQTHDVVSSVALPLPLQLSQMAMEKMRSSWVHQVHRWLGPGIPVSVVL